LLIHPTLDLLHQLGLNGMAKAFAELEASAEATTLTHPEWFALLLDQEASYRRDRRLAWTRQHLVELGFQHGLQEVANSIPKASFDRVELAVEKMAARLDFRLRQAGCPDMACLGVISAGASTPESLVGPSWRLRRLHFPTTPATAPKHGSVRETEAPHPADTPQLSSRAMPTGTCCREAGDAGIC